jgi:hypothetical protein
MSRQKSLQRKNSSEISTRRTDSEEPPSWSDLSKQADGTKFLRNTTVLVGITMFLSLFTGIGAFTAVFVVPLLGGIIGFGSGKSGAITGGIVSGATAFFGSILLSIVTLGLVTVLPAFIIGAIIGFAGGYIGKKLR